MKTIIKQKSGTSLLMIFLFSSLLLSGCSDSTSAGHEEEENIETMIAEIRNVTQSYHSIENAEAAGWDTFMSPCVEHPELGGMGYHLARMEFIDGRTNHLEPQVLLYEPTHDGGMEFVGVEYIIPFDIVPATADAPMTLGEHYHQNHELGIWALHVWTEKENPSGMFFDWNPNVSCLYVPENENMHAK